MTSRALFSARAGIMAPILDSASPQQNQDLFLDRGKVKTIPTVLGEEILEPVQGAGPQTLPAIEPRFEFQKEGDLPIRCYLEIIVSAITLGGGGATFVRLVDFPGVFLIDRIEEHSGSQLVHTIHPEYTMHCRRKDYNDHKRFQFDQLVGGNVLAATRSANAAAEQRFFLPIHHHWHGNDGAAPKLYGLANKLEFRVFLRRNYDEVLQTDGALAPNAFTVQCRLHTTLVHQLGVTRNMHVALTQRPGGLAHLYDHIQFDRGHRITAGDTQLTVQLRNFNLACKTLVILMRRATDDTALAREYNNFDQALIDNVEFEITSNSLDIIRRRNAQFRGLIDHYDVWAGSYGRDAIFPGDKPITYSFQYKPLMKNAITNWFDLGSTATPTLRIFSTAPGGFPEDRIVDVMAINYGVIQEEGGRIVRVFS